MKANLLRICYDLLCIVWCLYTYFCPISSFLLSRCYQLFVPKAICFAVFCWGSICSLSDGGNTYSTSPITFSRKERPFSYRPFFIQLTQACCQSCKHGTIIGSSEDYTKASNRSAEICVASDILHGNELHMQQLTGLNFTTCPLCKAWEVKCARADLSSSIDEPWCRLLNKQRGRFSPTGHDVQLE